MTIPETPAGTPETPAAAPPQAAPEASGPAASSVAAAMAEALEKEAAARESGAGSTARESGAGRTARESGTGSSTGSDAPQAKCPRCRTGLNHIKRAGQVLEACSACRGLWFDPGELTLLIQVHQRLDGGKPCEAQCPRCEIDLTSLTFPGTSVEVDRCPGCQGTWLDGGELETLQDQLRAIVNGPAWERTLEQAATSAQALAIFDHADQARARRFGCPKCANDLTHEKLEGHMVEACLACKGTWLDAGELTLLVGVYRELPTTGDQSNLSCVRCETTKLVSIEFPGTPVKVDLCPACRGSWVDDGVLDGIRAALKHLVPDDGKTLGERAQELFVNDPMANPQPRRGCPRCNVPLIESPLGRGVPCEDCPKCKGVWLDSGILNRLLGVIRKLKVKDGKPVDRLCVRCPKEAMVELEYPNSGLLIDLCPDCKGTWLDGGRLEALRERVKAPAT